MSAHVETLSDTLHMLKQRNKLETIRTGGGCVRAAWRTGIISKSGIYQQSQTSILKGKHVLAAGALENNVERTKYQFNDIS